MSETVEATLQEIFQQPLSASEQEAVEAIVAQHRNNSALTQQLAVDASRLITCSEERLKQQAESGFFKRFAGAFTGKSRQNQLQNQVDALHMQKIAWHYLKQLQQQNLINAQSIAVIRNNLGTMNEYIIETREFLFQAVDKINRRLIRVENNTSFHQWSLNIEANKRSFKSMPKVLLVLSLAYDFMRSHPGVALTAQDINHLIVTLEKLDVDCDEEVELLGFIINLIDQIEATSIERYRAIIELSFEEHVAANSYFIQKNISGLAFNSLYYLSDEYDRIIDMISDGKVCDSDEKRERIISRLFGKEFSGLQTKYQMRDLIEEIIGGSLLTLEIYKDQHGLNALPDEAIEDTNTETVALVSSLPDINAHTFFDTTDDREARRNYILLFALCIENSGALNRQGREFLELLAHKAGCPQVPSEITTLADNPRKTQDYLPILQDLLRNDNEVYTWLLDAFYLLTLCQKAIEVPNVQRILNTLKPAKFKEQFPSVLVVLTEQDEENVLAAAEKLHQQTHGWKNIVRYRELRFEKAFADMSTQLGKISFEAMHLSRDLTKATMKASEYSYFMEAWDDSFLSKVGGKVGGTAYTIGRGSCLSSLNELRKKIGAFISGHSSTLNQGNRLLTRWGLPSISFKDESGYADFELDNSATNEDWFDQFSHFERQLNGTLTSFSEACDDVASQLDLFVEGRFDDSVIEHKAKQRAERLVQQQQEKLTKQSVVIEKDGQDHQFSIEWSQVEHPPCDPEKVRDIKTDGTLWLIVDNDNRLYRSLDREHWQVVYLSASEKSQYISKLDFVGSMWIVVAGYSEGFYYSQDAQTWKQSNFPDVPGYELTCTEEISYFNGLWLWRFKERKEYSYIEKGLIFDTTKTGNYNKIAVFCTANLGNQWQRWEDTPSFPEGVVVESLQPLPGGNTLLAFCKYDWIYTTSKKKNNATSFVSYLIAGKSWRTCTWASEDDNYDSPLIARMGQKLLCFYSDHVMTSEKNGYEWKLQSKGIRINACAHLQDVSLFSTPWDRETLYVSQTGESFSELTLEEGRWKYFTANKLGALSVYAPNSHETFLRSGNYICKPLV